MFKTQQTITMDESRNRIIDLERGVTSSFHHPQENINSTQPNTLNLTQPNTLNSTQPLELLVIGSSIVKFIDAARIEKRKPDSTKTVCLPGAKINDILSGIKSLSKTYSIKKMVIHVGGNHIPHENPKSIITKLKDMVTQIISIMPETKIYYSLILPRISENYVYGINEINNAITSFCNTIKVNVIQHTEFCNNGVLNYNLLRKDVVHPSYKGTSIFAKNIIFAYRNYKKNYNKT